MKKYIDHLTVEEYELIKEQLKVRLPELAQKTGDEIGKRKYIETRFIILKIENIIKKYKK